MQAKFLSANNKYHFAWYDTQEVSAGTPQDHDAKRQRQPFTIQPFQGKALGIKDLLCISSNDTLHFAWYLEHIPKGDPDLILWVCAGPSESLGARRDWYRSVLLRGANLEDLRFITSNNKAHFAWYQKGDALWVGKGSSDNLAKEKPVRCEIPPDVKVEHILFMSTDDKQHFAFLKNGTYLVGSSTKLARSPQGVYDLEELKDVMKV
ncbi:MAG TPA: hypothetical protein PLL53_00470 [Saprospiraceae bacterium]|nr:hypothetical protein [Saprospiraceae bacterium]